MRVAGRWASGESGRACVPALRGAFQEPREVFVHDERDAGAGEDADEVRPEPAVEPACALVRPRVPRRRQDRTVMRLREHGVIL